MQISKDLQNVVKTGFVVGRHIYVKQNQLQLFRKQLNVYKQLSPETLIW